MIRSSRATPAACAIILLAVAGPNLEEGGEGSASNTAPIPCERRFVYSRGRRHCVRLERGALPDAELYEQGRALALAGHYLKALDVLGAISAPDAKVLTMVGYSQRKAGRV